MAFTRTGSSKKAKRVRSTGILPGWTGVGTVTPSRDTAPSQMMAAEPVLSVTTSAPVIDEAEGEGSDVISYGGYANSDSDEEYQPGDDDDVRSQLGDSDKENREPVARLTTQVRLKVLSLG